MSELVRGDRLPAEAKREVLHSFPYRWTTDNPQREQAWQYHGTNRPRVPLVTDDEWLREHAFYVTKAGRLDHRRNYAEPACLVEVTL